MHKTTDRRALAHEVKSSLDDALYQTEAFGKSNPPATAIHTHLWSQSIADLHRAVEAGVGQMDTLAAMHAEGSRSRLD